MRVETAPLTRRSQSRLSLSLLEVGEQTAEGLQRIMSGKPHLGDQEGTGVQDVPRTPQDAAAATAPLPADLFPEHSPSITSPLTCQRALQHAAQLYLTCLPPELREAVDRLLCCFAPAWHFTGALAPLDLSEFGVKNASEVQYTVRSNGERLLLALVSGVRFRSSHNADVCLWPARMVW